MKQEIRGCREQKGETRGANAVGPRIEGWSADVLKRGAKKSARVEIFALRGYCVVSFGWKRPRLHVVAELLWLPGGQSRVLCCHGPGSVRLGVTRSITATHALNKHPPEKSGTHQVPSFREHQELQHIHTSPAVIELSYYSLESHISMDLRAEPKGEKERGKSKPHRN